MRLRNVAGILVAALALASCEGGFVTYTVTWNTNQDVCRVATKEKSVWFTRWERETPARSGSFKLPKGSYTLGFFTARSDSTPSMQENVTIKRNMVITVDAGQLR